LRASSQRHAATTNTVVRELNTKTQTFPSVFIARSFGFTEREFFEVAEAERAVPKVSFGDDD
jgi:LemA protein